MGEHEAIFPPHAVLRRARRLLVALEHAEVVRMAGHNLSCERSELVNQRIQGFLGMGSSKSPFGQE